MEQFGLISLESDRSSKILSVEICMSYLEFNKEDRIHANHRTEKKTQKFDTFNEPSDRNTE